jgi:hypothetical protein
MPRPRAAIAVAGYLSCHHSPRRWYPYNRIEVGKHDGALGRAEIRYRRRAPATVPPLCSSLSGLRGHAVSATRVRAGARAGRACVAGRARASWAAYFPGPAQ